MAETMDCSSSACFWCSLTIASRWGRAASRRWPPPRCWRPDSPMAAAEPERCMLEEWPGFGGRPESSLTMLKRDGFFFGCSGSWTLPEEVLCRGEVPAVRFAGDSFSACRDFACCSKKLPGGSSSEEDGDSNCGRFASAWTIWKRPLRSPSRGGLCPGVMAAGPETSCSLEEGLYGPCPEAPETLSKGTSRDITALPCALPSSPSAAAGAEVSPAASAALP
mmetsp:Transcript_32889/g.78018  ORF Transcript_32889/g.78018 Transcript_32889/m.78018 type:complete len:221 (-) Transcript_32889:419-1081(-)